MAHLPILPLCQPKPADNSKKYFENVLSFNTSPLANNFLNSVWKPTNIKIRFCLFISEIQADIWEKIGKHAVLHRYPLSEISFHK